MVAHDHSTGRPAKSGDTVGGLVAWAVRALTGASSSPLLDAELLIAHVTGRPRSSVLAFPERVVRTALGDEVERLVERRARGEPLAYLVRGQEFYSLPLRVTPAVLIPRPETELLVDEALAHLPRGEPRAVLDLATGSGAVALALKHERPDANVTGSDVSAAALAIARANGERLGLDVRFVESDWFAALAGERFDLIVCNPPYVASDDRAFAELGYEPRLALDGGGDGLDALRAVLGGAREHLRPGGLLLVEHGYDQRAALVALAERLGWRLVAAHADLAGHARVLVITSRAGRES
ncbi:MAG TPA: peptide chain release factor N(5)-glutamine methyltransferase [Gammaproteobacteria bacterium]|nr:peptide chain release factor N(5)-glutamine methyltransferase [Gammaproteobacteria bacterium]